MQRGGLCLRAAEYLRLGMTSRGVAPHSLAKRTALHKTPNSNQKLFPAVTRSRNAGEREALSRDRSREAFSGGTAPSRGRKDRARGGVGAPARGSERSPAKSPRPTAETPRGRGRTRTPGRERRSERVPRRTTARKSSLWGPSGRRGSRRGRKGAAKGARSLSRSPLASGRRERKTARA